MNHKVEIYWESSDNQPDPTVIDLVREKRIPYDSICRTESDSGVRKSFLQVELPNYARDNNVDLLIGEAQRWLWVSGQQFGITCPMILVDGVRLSIYVLRIEEGLRRSLKAMDSAIQALKAIQEALQIGQEALQIEVARHNLEEELMAVRASVN